MAGCGDQTAHEWGVEREALMSRALNITDEVRIQFDPFGADDSKVEMETQKIVSVRKRHVCYGSYFPDEKRGEHYINIGDRARLDKALVEGDWCSYYFCLTCLDKMIRDNY